MEIEKGTEETRRKTDKSVIMKEKLRKEAKEKHLKDYELKKSSNLNRLINTVNHIGQFWSDLDGKDNPEMIGNRTVVLTGPYQKEMKYIFE